MESFTEGESSSIGKLNVRAIRKALLRWFRAQQRDLPWRRTRDPYAVWISEIMLQQTRVAAVIPYYERFLERFPDFRALAAAPEEEVLRMWAGLGYYSRARNLHRAARQMVELGGFPRSYETLRRLAGIGDYTAGAVASIAFGAPQVAIDGNVRRVVTRLSGDAAVEVRAQAEALLDRRHPGEWNQALMELGATVCAPRQPRCAQCPVARWCRARAAGLERVLPLSKAKAKPTRRDRTLLVIRRRGRLLLVPSARVAGFWDLPEPFPGAQIGARLGAFRHAITTSQYVFDVREARCEAPPPGARWWRDADLAEAPLATVAKKALALLRSV
jgi:A/G-specific adenine glycosylase